MVDRTRIRRNDSAVIPRSRPGSTRPLAIALALAVALAGGLAAPRETQAAAPEGYQLDLYRNGDFVAQTNLVQCVGASMQMMLNMINPTDDRTAQTQHRLWVRSRELSPPRPGNFERRGSSIWGWTNALNEMGEGPFVVVGYETLQEAARVGALSIARTGKPVGLLVWRGRHAWVMSGFRATADPLTDPNFQVTGVDVLDPLYPLGSRTWGPSPRPGSTLSMEQLGRQFVPRRVRANSALSGMYVMVIPATIVVPEQRTTAQVL
jgi:hypothetical protein